MFWSRSSKKIFKYWDGSKYRKIDPLVAWRRMKTQDDCVVLDDLPGATGRDVEGEECDIDFESQDRILTLVQDMFNVRQWTEDKSGLTVGDQLGLLYAFLMFMHTLKKKQDPWPTQSQPTDSQSQATSTTPQDADSFSIEPEQTSVSPQLS